MQATSSSFARSDFERSRHLREARDALVVEPTGNLISAIVLFSDFLNQGRYFIYHQALEILLPLHGDANLRNNLLGSKGAKKLA